MIINQIGGGKKPTGTKTITANGTYDVAAFANADVNVPTTAPARFIAYAVDAYGRLTNDKSSSNIINMTGCTGINDNYASLRGVYRENTAISGIIDWSSVQYIEGSTVMQTTFWGCTNITGVNWSGLIRVSGQYCLSGTFQNAGIEEINVSSLQQISGYQAAAYVFRNTQVVTASFPALSLISDNGVLTWAFAQCPKLESLYFGGLKSTSFGSYTNQFSGMLWGNTGCTVHFPSNLQSVIGSWADVINGFGGTNTTVLFDLAATE